MSARQYERVTGYVQGAIKEGAEVLAGGKRPAGEQYAKGNFLEPTVLRVTPAMKIWKEEVFGPVLSVVTFKSEEEALRLANDTGAARRGAAHCTAHHDRPVCACAQSTAWREPC